MSKSFLLVTIAIVVFGLILRLAPIRSNNFYFTMDQGNDAVHVREILERKQILLRGPETGIKGVYHGALWYYFIAIGYFLFGGHPLGAVFMLIILNLALTVIIMFRIVKKVSSLAAVTIGFSLQFFWWFYDTSRYAFNPFVLVFLSFLLVFFLLDVFEGRKRFYVFAAIPVGLAFHAESAAAIAFSIFYLACGAYFLIRRKLDLKLFIAGIMLIGVFLVPRVISEINTNFSQSRVLTRELREEQGVFSKSRYPFIALKFKEIISRRITPQSSEVGIFVFTFVSILFLKQKQKNSFTKKFTLLTFGLVLISFLWFGSNLGWQTWHTVYIRPLLYVALLLMIFDLPKKIAIGIFLIVIISQMLFFKTRYLENFNLSADASILANELAAVDWVYREAEVEGFYVYSYLPSVYDYPYQYLFWLRGKKHYGYVPCEYSTFPNTPSFFVPGEIHYQMPKMACQNLRFLIVEPDKNISLRERWLEQLRKDTNLIKQINFGEILVEKRVDNKKRIVD